jgi:predicted regulator of Ras-like GTPase activity (Roadblock/LC7/MglB family)
VNEIVELLRELRAVQGVDGAAVATMDGIMVHAELAPRLDPDAVAGLASFLVSTTRRAMDDDGTPMRFVIHATHGRIVLNDIGDAFLVVVADQFSDLDHTLEQADDIARRLRRAVRLS